MLLPYGCVWLMFLAIVADVKATVFVICGKPKFDELFGCGRCYSHIIDWLMSLP